MMRRFFESRSVAAATFTLFVLAYSWNATQGTGSVTPGHALFAPDAVLIAHGPGLPPDPWEKTLASHGPGLPPDPWERTGPAFC